jgi:aspartate-semialdehyde dehydrogenase
MLKVGFIGWRGMVGSVLLERMREESDFDGIESVFFTTSNVAARLRRKRVPAHRC